MKQSLSFARPRWNPFESVTLVALYGKHSSSCSYSDCWKTEKWCKPPSNEESQMGMGIWGSDGRDLCSRKVERSFINNEAVTKLTERVALELSVLYSIIFFCAPAQWTWFCSLCSLVTTPSETNRWENKRRTGNLSSWPNSEDGSYPDIDVTTVMLLPYSVPQPLIMITSLEVAIHLPHCLSCLSNHFWSFLLLLRMLVASVSGSMVWELRIARYSA